MSKSNEGLVLAAALLDRWFGKEEIKDLIWRVRIDPESITGRYDNKTGLARETVIYMEKRGVLPSLLAIMVEERPHINTDINRVRMLLGEDEKEAPPPSPEAPPEPRPRDPDLLERLTLAQEHLNAALLEIAMVKDSLRRT